MRIKTLLPVLAAVALCLQTPEARSQWVGESLVAWFTGDANVGMGPTVPEGPKLYAEDTCCASGCCGCCNECCRCYDVWGSVEFLMWWAKGTPIPPLVTTSLPGTPQAEAGILGLDSTSILFGDELGANKLRGGGRVTAGIWLDPDHNVAAGGRFFGLGGDTSRFAATSTGTPSLPCRSSTPFWTSPTR